MITVGSERDVGGSLKIFSGEDVKHAITFTDDENTQFSDSLGLTDICKVVSADSLLQNIVVSTNRGELKVLGMPPRFLRSDKKFCH